MPQQPELAVVTGAFSYTGGYIARKLLMSGISVTTLTRHPDTQNAFQGKIQSAALDFSDKTALIKAMQGASVFYNTYWIRFERGNSTFDQAVQNSKILFEAAIEAGIQKIVHISVSNPSPESPLPYFKGKWQVEQALKSYSIPYTIIRPTLVFGNGDLLMNNIAWALRRFPLFPVYGNGKYLVQPVYAEDVAELAVTAAQTDKSFTIDAAGTETLSFKEILQLTVSAMRVRTKLIHTPPSVGLALTNMVGIIVRDIVLTSDEVKGLTAGLLTSDAPPTAKTKLTDWLNENASQLGRTYQSELKRNFSF